MEDSKIYIDYIAIIIEAIGVAAIFIGLVYSFVLFFISMVKKKTNLFRILRQTLGKSILLGLEILIAADIIANGSLTLQVDGQKRCLPRLGYMCPLTQIRTKLPLRNRLPASSTR